jgi:Right handed beta helix region
MSHLRALVAAWGVATLAGLVGAAPAATGQGGPQAPDATGRADATGDLQALLDGTPDGEVVHLERGGDYRVDGTLVLEDRHDLTIDGNGARIFATTTGDIHRSQIRIIGGSGFDVRDLEIEGANPRAGLEEGAYQQQLEGQHGIRLDGVTDVELDRVNIHDTYGDLVYISRHEEDRRWTEQVWIHDSTFADSGRQGIAVVAGRDVVIERNTITRMARAGVDLEPNSPAWGADNIHVLDNEVGPGRLLFVAAGGRGPVNRVVIARNTLRGRDLKFWVIAPEGQRRHWFWVVDNTSDTAAAGAPLEFTRSDGVVVHGNRQPITGPGEALVKSVDSCDVSVTDNDTAPGTRALEGRSRQCNFILPVEPPAPPPVAGRNERPPGTGSAATTTTTGVAPPGSQLAASDSRGGDGVAGPVVIVAMVLAALTGAGGAVAFSAWRGRR